MAKKAKGGSKAFKANAAGAGAQHTCASYKLTMANAHTALRFGLEVVGDDGNDYFLRVKLPNDRVALVKRALATIGKFWPQFNWPFQADANNSIIDIG